MLRSPTYARVLVASLAVLAIAPASKAQSRLSLPYDGPALRLEALKPFLENDDETTFATSVIGLAGQAAVGTVLLEAQLPISHFGIDGEMSETAIGNPYVGVRSKVGTGATARGGVRFPLAGDNGGTLTGILADFDHIEAYVPDLLSISAAGGYRYVGSGAVGVDGEVGATAMIPTKDGGDTEALLDYSIRALLGQGQVRVGVGLTGRALMTGEDGEGLFGESKTEHHVGLTAAFSAGSVEPHVHLRFPIGGDLKDAVGLVVGVGLTARIGKS